MKNFLNLALKELSILFTAQLFSVLNLLGSGAFGNRARAAIMRMFGMKIAKGALIAPNVYIHGIHSQVSIGEGSFVNKSVHFDAAAPVTIGRHCDIGYYSVFTTSSHPLRSNFKGRRPAYPVAPIVIEDFVWLGGNVTVLGGVTIGRGSVVGAGSIVTKDIPPNCLAVGTPARVIRSLDEEPVNKPVSVLTEEVAS